MNEFSRFSQKSMGSPCPLKNVRVLRVPREFSGKMYGFPGLFVSSLKKYKGSLNLLSSPSVPGFPRIPIGSLARLVWVSWNEYPLSQISAKFNNHKFMWIFNISCFICPSRNQCLISLEMMGHRWHKRTFLLQFSKDSDLKSQKKYDFFWPRILYPWIFKGLDVCKY